VIITVFIGGHEKHLRENTLDAQKTFECPYGWVDGWMEGGRLRAPGAWMDGCVCRLMTK